MPVSTPRGILALLTPCATLLAGCGAAEERALPEPAPFTVVELAATAPAPLQLAVHACAGLRNRARGGSVYVHAEAHDAQWLGELALEPAATVPAADFLATCAAELPACARYSYASQQRLLPSILTVASALGALPLDDGLGISCAEVAFDATTELAARDTPLLATRYAFEHHLGATTGLAMLNPGYDLNAGDVSNPGLTRDMPAAMVDFVFSERLFVHFLVNGCQDSDPERELLQEIVDSGTWATPAGVYGYNNSWMVAGGYVNEAQTRCLDSRNLGAIPTETQNLSFFSTRRAPIRSAGELAASPPDDTTYDPSKTYVAFVIGDGDNVRYIMTTRSEWLRERLAACEQSTLPCPPLTWSLSPHLPRLAPDVLEWYYETSRRTGRDYFVLPPSGHLYAYPSSLNEADQARFVAATEADARVLGVTGTVHWDWSGTWTDAEERFLPRYARKDGVIRGVFPVNVPYMFPTFTWWEPEEFYRVLTGPDGGQTVVFKPREWRGIDDRDEFFLSPANLATEIASYPPGTVTWVYMTSDGGLTLGNSFSEVAELVPAHVQLVSTDAAAKLALAAARR